MYVDINFPDEGSSPNLYLQMVFSTEKLGEVTSPPAPLVHLTIQSSYYVWSGARNEIQDRCA